MSEYQFYGFLAIDRPLDDAARKALRTISSRASITTNSFTNVYNWGDLSGDPIVMLGRWFDIFVYSGFWQARRFAMRVPKRLLDRAVIESFEPEGECLSVSETGDSLIVEISLTDMDLEYGGDESEWLVELAPLRAAVLAGDLRCFYVVWLMQVGWDDVIEDHAEEPMPWIGPLDPVLTAWARFLGADDDLLAAAAENGAPAPAEPSEAQVRAFLHALPDDEKVDLLLKVYDGSDLALGPQLRRRVQASLQGADAAQPRRRTAGDLRAAAARIAEAQVREAELREEAAKRQRARQVEAIERLRRAEIAKRGDDVWNEIEAAIARRNTMGYEQAVSLLLDLKAIGRDPALFQRRLAAIRVRHDTKRSFLTKLAGAGLDAGES